jgi:hypothetical protein
MVRKTSRLIWIALGILIISGVLLMFLMASMERQREVYPGMTVSVSIFETRNAKIDKFITATIAAKTQNAGR